MEVMINGRTFDVWALPSLPLRERVSLPRVSAIYFASNDNEGIFYIGKAKNLVQRWAHHHRLDELLNISSGEIHISWLEVDIENLADMERACIRFFDPILNKGGPIDRDRRAYRKAEKAKAEDFVSSVRLPRALYERIRKLAARDRRSISAEIEVLLERAAAQAESERGATETSSGNRAPAPCLVV